MEPEIRVVLFDVNETLSDMTPLQHRFEQLGAPPLMFRVWFASVLRDGFALTAAGGYADFGEFADGALRDLFAGLHGWRGDPADAARHVLEGFGELDLHPDVADGVRRMRAAGLRLATLTNGSAGLTAQLLERAGVRDHFQALLDVSGPRAWKPAAAAYQYALAELGAQPDETMLVAVHPWDVDGARRAGLHAAWLSRGVADYPRVMIPPTVTAADLRDLAYLLTATA
jgi:2-haloacid dehalogenase